MKKIKAKKYTTGGTIIPPNFNIPSFDNIKLQATPEVAAYAPGNRKPSSSTNMFKSGQFAQGASTAANALGAASIAAPTFINNMTQTNASSISEARKQTAANSINGTLAGAKAGMTIGGPIGGIVGGLAGLATGLIGKKGHVDNVGYYEDPTVTYGTGLRGRQNRRLKRKYEQLKTLAGQHRLGQELGQDNLDQFMDEYDTDIQLMSVGGSVQDSLAYVDDGELLNLPQGDMVEVPEEGKPTDSNLVSLPEGTKILSDKIKVPGTKETFAQMGKRLMSKKKTKGTDIYAQNSQKLNEANDQAIYDKLFALQESMKVNKKTKNGIQAAADGDVITRYGRKWIRDGKTGYYTPYKGEAIGSIYDIQPEAKLDTVFPRNEYQPDKYVKSVPTAETATANTNATASNNVRSTRTVNPSYFNMSSLAAKTAESDKLVNSGEWRGGTPYWLLPAPAGVSTTASTPQKQIPYVAASKAVTRTGATRRASGVSTISKANTPVTIEPVENNLDLSSETLARVEDEVAPYISSIPSNNTTTPVIVSPRAKRNIDLSNLLTDATALSPVISNMLARPEYFESIHNPYSSSIRNNMAGRRYDISPAKRAIRENTSVGNYNASVYNPNTGANMAFRLQNQIAANKAISDLYATASNANNQYKAEYANMLNNLGQQFVQARNLAIDQNARSRATTRNINRTALSQLSQFAQNKQLMKNKKNMDMAMLDMYEPFLAAGYNYSDLQNFLNKFKNK